MTRISSLATIYGDLLILPGISTSDRIIRLLVEEGKFSNSIFQKPADSESCFTTSKDGKATVETQALIWINRSQPPSRDP